MKLMLTMKLKPTVKLVLVLVMVLVLVLVLAMISCSWRHHLVQPHSTHTVSTCCCVVCFMAVLLWPSHPNTRRAVI
jgi:hypothetical protein